VGGTGGPVDRHGFVVLEGPDTAGKTTFATYLGRTLGAVVLGFPPDFARVRRETRLDEQPVSVRLGQYLEAARETARSVQAAQAGSHVVFDRFLIGPVAAMVAEGVLQEEQAEEALSSFRPPTLPAPDLILVMVTDHPRSVERLARGGGGSAALSPIEARWVASPALHANLAATIARLCRSCLGEVIELDTTDFSVEEMCTVAGRLVDRALGLQGARP
jgi:thymidylate kinase